MLENRCLLTVIPGSHLSTGTHLTTLTLALATTGEFTQAAGGKFAAISLLDRIVDELNQVFESELAIRVQLHTNNSRLIFENAAADGYTNGVSATMIDENPGVINGAINGSPSNDTGYDLGHVIGIGPDGGFAIKGSKARGATDLAAANASASTIKAIGHELAHQLGASHSFNGLRGSCAGGRDPEWTLEPGSGSSLLGYQGTCDADNLPERDGDGTYVHAASFDEIVRYLTSSRSDAGVRTPTGNSLPVVNAGPDRMIPAATPFALTSTVSDPNAGDQLTLTWDQIDASPAGGVSVPIASGQDGQGPLFRSYAPTSDRTRIFPRIQELVANTPASQNVEDHLPTQPRDLHFRVTVRDNHLVNGRAISGVTSDDVRLSVVATGSPFRVTSLNSPAGSMTGGSSAVVTWDVAGTTANGINVSQVDILLSGDGGLTYPAILASATSNDGSETVLLPNLNIAAARIMVRADRAQNVFFDINDASFRITQNPAVTGGIAITEPAGGIHLAEGLFSLTGMAAAGTYQVGLTQPSVNDVDLTVTADPQLRISLDGESFASSQTLTFAAGESLPRTITVRAIDDVAEEGSHFGVIRHAVTRSLDPSYRVEVLREGVVAPIVVRVADDDAPPMIGAELDFSGPNPTVPENWTRIEQPYGISVSNLTRENGIATAADLTIKLADPSAAAGWSVRTNDPSTVPQHMPDIRQVHDVMFWMNSVVTATWRELQPNAKYLVYVFTAAEVNTNSEAAVIQTVTITGNGSNDPPPFVQNGTGKITGSGSTRLLHLLVNGSVGDSSRPLEEYGLPVAATADGTISIRVDPASGRPSVLAALAVQELFEAPVGFSVDETAGGTEVHESGATDTIRVVLTSPPATDVRLSVSSSDPGEAAVNKSALLFTRNNWDVPQTITISGVEDGIADGDQTISVTVAVDGPNSDPAFRGLASRTIDVLVLDSATMREWLNASNRFDVSGDGIVVPLDVLRVINELNIPRYRDSEGKLPLQRPAGASFYDVNADGFVTANDALRVVNHLNGLAVAEGESSGMLAGVRAVALGAGLPTPPCMRAEGLPDYARDSMSGRARPTFHEDVARGMETCGQAAVRGRRPAHSALSGPNAAVADELFSLTNREWWHGDALRSGLSHPERD